MTRRLGREASGSRPEILHPLRARDEKTMYEMYPSDWAPSQHRDEASEAVQTALDLRDNGGERPDDN